MRLPAHVEAISFEGIVIDVQDLYARCALLVTNWSVAFNIAYIDAPVVYFQYDGTRCSVARTSAAAVLQLPRGAWVRAGHTDLDAAVDAVVDAIDHGPRPPDYYQARIDR